MKNRMLVLLMAAGLALLPATAVLADSDITASNESDDTETQSGDATAHNSGSAFVGQQGGGETDVDSVESSDIDSTEAVNVQEGDNELDAEQVATSSSGDTVGGQVIGGVVTGNLTVDATNLSSDIEAISGDADSSNDFDAFIGLSNSSSTSIGAAGDDVTSDRATNLQVGDNGVDLMQRTDAVSGDAVGGQVFGATVTGAVDAVLANTSDDATAESGDADEVSDADLFTGLLASGAIDVS